MNKKVEIKLGTCVYCGKVKPITDDHIPPKSLFGKPRPNNLITVKSCYSCNLNCSEDDEYFRTSLSLREDVFDNIDVQQIFPKVIRSFDKPTKIGFKKSFLNSIEEIEYISSSGIFLGYKQFYNVDFNRLARVVSRIVRGLYSHHFNKILPQDYESIALISEGMKNVDPKILFGLKENLLNPLSKNKRYVIGKVFEYKYSFDQKDNFISAWIMRFYQKVYFISMTFPKNQT